MVLLNFLKDDAMIDDSLYVFDKNNILVATVSSLDYEVESANGASYIIKGKTPKCQFLCTKNIKYTGKNGTMYFEKVEFVKIDKLDELDDYIYFSANAR